MDGADDDPDRAIWRPRRQVQRINKRREQESQRHRDESNCSCLNTDGEPEPSRPGKKRVCTKQRSEAVGEWHTTNATATPPKRIGQDDPRFALLRVEFGGGAGYFRSLSLLGTLPKRMFPGTTRAG